jgi:glutamate N-acetyltransferase/amino-acid N-acetyltransferase
VSWQAGLRKTKDRTTAERVLRQRATQPFPFDMAVGEVTLPVLHPVAGVRLGTARAGIRYPDRRDLVVMEFAPYSSCAAVFTRNAFRAAPVVVAAEHLNVGNPQYFLINTGNANAGTGIQGVGDARACCAALSDLTGCGRESVLPFSTGVIGEPLPVSRIKASLPLAVEALDEEGWPEAAYGILTTDTVPKGTSVRLMIDGTVVTVTGIAKGSGMIRPDMATMLAFMATDAAVEPPLLQRCLERAVGHSFNRITVDGDTSTNDACMLVATGGSQGPRINVQDEAFEQFSMAVTDVCIELAKAIVRDGEGATKFVTIEVSGARSGEECLAVAYSIAHSPLVKTAFFASDPNWGRILAAIGRAGLADLDLGGVSIFLDHVCIVRGGCRADDYTEEAGRQVMRRSEIVIRVELCRGEATECIWTCDLSYEYVRINAEYRT